MFNKNVKLVGILNITPDSFSDGGNFFAHEDAIRRAGQLFHEGAAIVDIGGESTRPGAIRLSDNKEWSRLEKVLSILIPKYPGKISVDSYHPATIEKALAIGRVIVNDVTGMNNQKMVDIVVRNKSRVIVSHLNGDDIEKTHLGTLIDDVNIVKDDLLKKAEMLVRKGLPNEHIILDPGIGFGKTPRLNQELLSFAHLIPDFEVMIGYSRKRFLGENRMDIGPNLAAAKIAIESGATYLRVHDVKSHADFLGIKFDS
jgi:dihydropteroate synthase